MKHWVVAVWLFATITSWLSFVRVIVGPRLQGHWFYLLLRWLEQQRHSGGLT